MTQTAVIADDHALIRLGIAQILTSAGLTVVGEAENGLEAVAQVRSHQPALLTLDIAMPYARGIEVFGEARRWSPATKIIVFSGLTSSGLVRELNDANADGIFLKRGDVAQFAEAVPRVLAGERIVCAEAQEMLLTENETAELTMRERQILSLLAQGFANKAISLRLGVSIKTVDNHRTNLMRKLGAHSMAELLAFALREGLLDSSREI
ncbi:response regulator transcription factor [Phycobacter sp. K97]|uniref:response regulator transcription factor n=1 Tax=Phycobacter sedimenti TaxID=3133977 RepID=UPI00311D8A88